MWYAHSLLFACPNCNFPIAISLVSEKKNFEDVDEELVAVKCSLCGQASEVIAVTARTHWVTDWTFDSMISKLNSQSHGQIDAHSDSRW